MNVIIEPRVQCVYNTCSGARETAPDMRPTRMQNSGGSRLPFGRGGDGKVLNLWQMR